MASSFVSQCASCVLFVDNVQVGTLENRVPISLRIPSVAVSVPVLPIFSEDGLNLQIANQVDLKIEKVTDVNSVKLKAGDMSSVPLSFFSSGGEGMVFVGFLSLPSVGVGVEAVRLAEPEPMQCQRPKANVG